jgi:hypothetical protein
MYDDMVGAIAIIIIFGGPLAAWIVWRVLAHQERIEMIRRGFVPPDLPPPPMGRRHWRGSANWGPPGPVPPQTNAYAPPPAPGAYEYYAQAQLRKGITLTMVGLALLIGLSFIGPLSGIFFFGPWMLGGLIPMFVGIAQIINALLNGARIPGAWGGSGNWGGSGSWGQPGSRGGSGSWSGSGSWGQPPSDMGSSAGPAPSGQAQPGQRDVSQGPTGWRPGPTPEIPKPTPPPDRR